MEKVLLLQKVFEHDNNLITTLDMIKSTVRTSNGLLSSSAIMIQEGFGASMSQFSL